MDSMRRTSVVTMAGAALLLAVTGCNSHKSSTAAPAAAAPSRAATIQPTSQPTSPARGNASAAPGSKTCPAGTVSGRIGGASKCLAVGQQCSAKHVADYTQYGFVCNQNGTRYILARKQ